MVTIVNQKQLNEVIEANVLRPLFLNEETEKAVLVAVSDNVSIYTENYGDNGAGGFIGIIPDDISYGSGKEEYLETLSRHHIKSDEWEFEDVLGTNGEYDIRMQLFVLTEYNILLLFRKKVNS